MGEERRVVPQHRLAQGRRHSPALRIQHVRPALDGLRPAANQLPLARQAAALREGPHRAFLDVLLRRVEGGQQRIDGGLILRRTKQLEGNLEACLHPNALCRQAEYPPVPHRSGRGATFSLIGKPCEDSPDQRWHLRVGGFLRNPRPVSEKPAYKHARYHPHDRNAMSKEAGCWMPERHRRLRLSRQRRSSASSFFRHSDFVICRASMRCAHLLAPPMTCGYYARFLLRESQCPSSSCAACGRQLQAKDELAGKRVRCPQCGQPVAIPAARAPAVRPGRSPPASGGRSASTPAARAPLGSTDLFGDLSSLESRRRESAERPSAPRRQSAGRTDGAWISRSRANAVPIPSCWSAPRAAVSRC